MRRLFGSFLSAAAGWAAGLAVLFVFLAVQLIGSPSTQNASEAFTALLGVGFFMGLYILVVWALALVPLYFLVPASSALWRPGVCTLCGALAGLGIALALFSMARDPAGVWPFYIVSVVVGAATCFVGACTRDRFHPPAAA